MPFASTSEGGLMLYVERKEKAPMHLSVNRLYAIPNGTCEPSGKRKQGHVLPDQDRCTRNLYHERPRYERAFFEYARDPGDHRGGWRGKNSIQQSRCWSKKVELKLNICTDCTWAWTDADVLREREEVNTT
jgi:hypothetical protein